MVNKIKIFKKFKVDNKFKGSIILIGNFDGLHLGHQKLFYQAKKYKSNIKLKLALLLLIQSLKCFLIKN